MFTIKLSEQEIIISKPKDKTFRLTVGGGLYVLVNMNKSKVFRFDYSFQDKRNTLSLGNHPNISLFEALVLHREAQSQLEDGFNPSAMRKAEKRLAADGSTHGEAMTFETVANEWGLINTKDWLDSNQTKRQLETLFPLLGSKPISEIKPAELLYCIAQIEEEGFKDKANRTLGSASNVFIHAVERKYCLVDITQTVKDCLKAK